MLVSMPLTRLWPANGSCVVGSFYNYEGGMQSFRDLESTQYLTYAAFRGPDNPHPPSSLPSCPRSDKLPTNVVLSEELVSFSCREVNN